MALTARLSAHPFILGASPEAPPFESITPAYLVEHPDLREYGARREAMCEKLREKAIRLAWERGTLVESSEDSMACCHLLEVLEGREPPFFSSRGASADSSDGQGLIRRLASRTAVPSSHICVHCSTRPIRTVRRL